MSLATQIQALATRVGAEIKTLREVDIPAVETLASGKETAGVAAGLVGALPKDYDLVLHAQVFS